MPRSGAPREKLDGGRLKGGMFRSHMAWLKENATPAQRDEVLARLPEETRRQLSGLILVSTWFPFEALVELDRAIMDVCGGGRLEIVEQLGKWSARINLSTTYRAFDRGTNHEFFENAALLQSQFQDFGKVAYERRGDSAGTMVHSEYPCFSPIFCASAIGYYEGAIEAHHGSDAKVRETSCQCFGDPHCTFEMTWR